MEENPKEYGIFCACYTDPKHKNTYSGILLFSPEWATPSKNFLRRRTADRVTPSHL